MPSFLLPDSLDAAITPALLIDLDRVKANVRRVIELIGGNPSRWRPHVKTVKVPIALRVLLDAGVRHFKAATPREVATLLETAQASDIDDVDILTAHPVQGPGLARLATLAARFPSARLSVLVEDETALAEIPGELGVFVDVDPGMHRTGIPLDAFESARALAAAAGSRLWGFHAYEGHIVETDDGRRRAMTDDIYAAVIALVDHVRETGIVVPELVTSGTRTFLDAATYDGFGGEVVHRLSPGTVVYHDMRTEETTHDLGLDPAAAVLTRVVSHPGPSRVTCDAGSKAVAVDAGDPCVVVAGHPGLVARTPTEEHLPLDVVDGRAPPRGTRLALLPRHVCPTVNLAEEAIIIEGGAVIGVTPVTARGHDPQTAWGVVGCYPARTSS